MLLDITTAIHLDKEQFERGHSQPIVARMTIDKKYLYTIVDMETLKRRMFQQISERLFEILELRIDEPISLTLKSLDQKPLDKYTIQVTMTVLVKPICLVE